MSRFDRRTILSSGALAPLLAAGTSRAAQATNAPPATGAGGVTRTIAGWASGLRYDALPDDVRLAARRYLLDAVGCALAGWHTDKGRLAANTMTAMGGSGSTIVGSGSAAGIGEAAFANAELINALDFDALPHTPPVTLAALLAVAERQRLDGRRLLTAIVAAHEIAVRLQQASSQMIASLLETGTTPEVFGINTESIIATAAALGNLMALDPQKTAQAMGLAAYYCPPQSAHDWETLSPKTNVKYTPVGSICQAAVNAGMLAAQGFTSHPSILDGDMAFPRFYGYKGWRPEAAIDGYGKRWTIVDVDFKAHAACRFTHSQIDCMQTLVGKHDLRPEQIVTIETLGLPFVANPRPYDVRTAEDGQFSTPYVIALAAHRMPVDARAYDADRMSHEGVRRTMTKIRTGIHPDSAASRTDWRRMPARVTVTTTDGRKLVEESLYPIGTGSVPGFRLTDAQLSAKFMANASLLPKAQADRLHDALWAMDSLDDVGKALRLAAFDGRKGVAVRERGAG